MDNKLINQLVEKDLFAGPTPEEVKKRQATRPAVVLEGEEIIWTLQMTVATMINDLGAQEITEYLITGDAVLEKPLGRMTTKELIKEALTWARAFFASGTVEPPDMTITDPNKRNEQILLKMIKTYLGETYDKIEGF